MSEQSVLTIFEANTHSKSIAVDLASGCPVASKKIENSLIHWYLDRYVWIYN